MAMGYSSRNGRVLRLGVMAALAAFGIFMVVLYQRARSESEGLQLELGDAHERHTKINSELKRSLQSHAQLERDLKSERLQRSRAEEDKDKAMIKCAEDLRSVRKHGKEQEALAVERDSFKSIAAKHELNYNDVKDERDRLQDEQQKCDRDRALSDERFANLRASSQESENGLKRKIQEIQDEIDSLKSQQTELQLQSSQCSNSLAAARTSLEQSTQRVQLLEAETKSKDSEIRILRGRLEESQPLQKDRDVKQPAVQRADLLGEQRQFRAPMRDTSDRDGTAKVDDTKKRQVYQTLQDMVDNGEKLSSKQIQIYNLLKKQLGSVRGAPPSSFPSEDQREGGYPPRARVPQDKVGGDLKSLQVAGNQIQQPPGGLTRVGRGDAGPQQKISIRKDEFGGWPVLTGGEEGGRYPDSRQLDGDFRKDQYRQNMGVADGDELGGAGPHPLEEKEEVKDLRYEDENKPRGSPDVRGGKEMGGGGVKESEGMKDEEEFDNLEKEEGKEEKEEKEEEEEEGEDEEDEGGAQQFLPEEIDQLEREQEEEENFQENEEDNAENGDQPLPNPQEVEEEEFLEVRGGVEMPQPGADEQYPEVRKVEPGKSPPEEEGDNLDKQFDDYDKNFKYGEDDANHYEYKDSEEKELHYGVAKRNGGQGMVEERNGGQGIMEERNGGQGMVEERKIEERQEIEQDLRSEVDGHSRREM